MITLALDTAGSACSVAVGRDGALLANHRREMRHGHAEALMPMVDAAMRAAGLEPQQLDAVAVSLGPGGFTGIRVGLAAAHGIALAVGARVIGVTSFAAVAALIADPPLLVALDSRRADLYVQLFTAQSEPVGAPEAVLPDHLAGWVPEGPLTIAGDAAEAAHAALAGRAGVTLLADTAPDARGVLATAMRQTPGGVSEARPLYLRPPDVTFPASAGPRPPRRRAARRIDPLPPTAAAPLAILHRACFPDEPWEADAMARILGLSGCFGYFAWERETPTGFVLARDLGDEGEILSVGVVPDARSRGLGARLMQTAIGETRRRGCNSVVLEVAADNQAARRLYTKLGFAQVGRRPRYYRRADGMADALILRLSLRNTLT